MAGVRSKRRRLPPPHTLRAFESAAEHLSFTKAAQKLHLTQSAVSQQIRQLEDELGCPLFRRVGRALVLTEAGRILYSGVGRALTILRDTVDRLDRARSLKRLVVSVLPSFGTKWLVPRLHRFLQREPEVRLTIIPSTELVDFATDDVDVALRWSNGHHPGFYSKLVLSESEFPVCAPDLLQRRGPLSAPSELLSWPFLADVTHDMWSAWLACVGIEVTPPAPVASYDDASDLIQAAISGQGVALARSALVAEDLLAGRLVTPVDRELVTERAYYLVCPQETAHSSWVLAFERWLAEESALTTQSLERRPSTRPITD
jgi:LysR family glycine cleavage system transcriptional activator